MKTHSYKTQLKWTGNKGQGTSSYQAYERSHEISIEGKKHNIQGSSDPAFLGDPSCFNPEELLVSSISSCHMLWYLHLCTVNKIVVTHYEDQAKGSMSELQDGSGHFTAVHLYPKVTITDINKKTLAIKLHAEAHQKCFIANSCNFLISHQPEILIAD